MQCIVLVAMNALPRKKAKFIGSYSCISAIIYHLTILGSTWGMETLKRRRYSFFLLFIGYTRKRKLVSLFVSIYPEGESVLL